ncbi:MAG: hypothetical protein JSS14_21815 [Proteobacteria bacterium]|nr:hypothetical protein [Pseudomonadota bacterium]
MAQLKVFASNLPDEAYSTTTAAGGIGLALVSAYDSANIKSTNYFRSTDGGSTWSTVAHSPAPTTPCTHAGFNGSYFNFIFVEGSRVTTDGATWTTGTYPTARDKLCVANSSGTWCVGLASTTGTGTDVMVSTDGVAWTVYNVAVGKGSVISVLWDGATYWALVNREASPFGWAVYQSNATGTTWTLRGSGASAYNQAGIYYNGSVFLIQGTTDTDNPDKISADGATWAAAGTQASKILGVSNGVFIRLRSSVLEVSADGATWAAPTTTATGVAFDYTNTDAGRSIAGRTYFDSTRYGSPNKFIYGTLEYENHSAATVTLRDDFTGSGSVVGRSPDGADGGNWINVFWAGDATPATVASGTLALSNSLDWDAKAVMTQPATDVYAETRLTHTGGYTGCQLRLGLRYNLDDWHGSPLATGQYVIVQPVNATRVDIYVPGIVVKETGWQSFTVPNANSIVARLELVGKFITIFLNGVPVRQTWYTDLSEVVSGQGIYVYNSTYGGQMDYIEGGMFAAPVTPPFWTAFIGSHEAL